MKRILLIKYNILIAFILSLLGMGSACIMGGCEYGTPAEEYGTPTAHFKVYGNVSSEAGPTIQGIRVVMQNDTTFTDSKGNYQVLAESFPEEQQFLVSFNDMDGEENGRFQAKDTLINFENPKFEKGDGSWYKGEASKKTDIRLNPEN